MDSGFADLIGCRILALNLAFVCDPDAFFVDFFFFWGGGGGG